jgi:hypothetical protein
MSNNVNPPTQFRVVFIAHWGKFKFNNILCSRNDNIILIYLNTSSRFIHRFSNEIYSWKINLSPARFPPLIGLRAAAKKIESSKKLKWIKMSFYSERFNFMTMHNENARNSNLMNVSVFSTKAFSTFGEIYV